MIVPEFVGETLALIVQVGAPEERSVNAQSPVMDVKLPPGPPDPAEMRAIAAGAAGDAPVRRPPEVRSEALIGFDLYPILRPGHRLEWRRKDKGVVIHEHATKGPDGGLAGVSADEVLNKSTAGPYVWLAPTRDRAIDGNSKVVNRRLADSHVVIGVCAAPADLVDRAARCEGKGIPHVLVAVEAIRRIPRRFVLAAGRVGRLGVKHVCGRL